MHKLEVFLEKVGFFTPISYGLKKKSTCESLSGLADNLLDFGGKRAVVLQGRVVKGNQLVEIQPKEKNSRLLKIVGCITGILPLIALLVKAVYRSTHHFEIIKAGQQSKAPADPKATPPKSNNPANERAGAQESTADTKKTSAKTSSSMTSEKVKATQDEFDALSAEYKKNLSFPPPQEETKPLEEPKPSESGLPGLTKTFLDASEEMKRILKEVKDNHDPITMGYGEYAVYHKDVDSAKPVSEETFYKVYELFLKYLPHLSKEGLEQSIKTADRYELLRTKVKEIDPALEVSFIPRTLYELIYIRKCIEEAFEYKKMCPQMRLNTSRVAQLEMKKNENEDLSFLERSIKTLEEEVEKTFKDEKVEEKCWHLCYFDDNFPGDNQDQNVKKTAFRLNNVLFENLPQSGRPLNFAEISSLAQDQISYLSSIHGNEELCKMARHKLDWSQDDIGVAGSFAIEKETAGRHSSQVFPMGLKKKTAAKKMLRKAIAIECSKVAERSLLLCRGSFYGYSEDKPIIEKYAPFGGKNTFPLSLSFGVTLFAGSNFDGGATAFSYMRRNIESYMIPVPFDQVENGPFYVPLAHTVSQLSSKGEWFHGRSKCWKQENPETDVYGYSTGSHKKYKDWPDSVKCDKTQEEFYRDYYKIMDQAIALKKKRE